MFQNPRKRKILLFPTMPTVYISLLSKNSKNMSCYLLTVLISIFHLQIKVFDPVIRLATIFESTKVDKKRT